MFIDRLADGTLVVETRWQDFAAEYRAAPKVRRAVLMDGRPAVVRPQPEGEPSYLTVPPAVWHLVRVKVSEHLAGQPAPKRVRHCQNCDAELRVAREYAHAWTFTCPGCGSREVWGKAIVGGTEGAGEVEKR